VRATTRQPGLLFAELETHVVDTLWQSGMAGEGERHDALAAARQFGGDPYAPGRYGDEGSGIPSFRGEVAAHLVDQAAREVGRERRHHAAATLRARAARGRAAERADAGRLLGTPSAGA